MTFDDLVDAADIDQVGADADDHGLARSRDPGVELARARDPWPPAWRVPFAKADEQRLPDQVMADVEFDDLGQCRDLLRGHVVEAVAGMDFEAGRARQFGARDDPLPFARRAFAAWPSMTASHQAPV